MTDDTAFAVCLGFACLVSGILIGVLIMVCYRRVVCCVLSERLSHHGRNSAHSLQGIHSVSGNHHLQHIIPSFQMNGPLGSSNDRPFDLTNLDHSNDRRTRNHSQINDSHPTPLDLNQEEFGHSDNRRNGTSRINDVNRENIQSSNRTAKSEMEGSGRSERSHENVTFRYSSAGGEAFLMQPLGTSRNEQNNNTGHDNIKDSGNKLMPYGAFGGHVSLPPEERPKEVRNINSDDFDTTIVKMFVNCPEDIRTMFEPSTSSRMINLREKKVVYVCKRLGDEGGLLELEHMGISLFVPPGAIPFKQHNLVSLVLNWDLNDNPPMERKEALVSPVVYCGPHGSTFEKPCLLKFKHCAHDTRFARILTSQTDLFDNKNWQQLDRNLEPDDQEDDDDDDVREFQPGVSLTVNECQVEVPHFSLFTCIMRSKNRSLKKWIQVAVFTHDVDSDLRHQEIRIYFLNKTPCALQWAMQNEASYGFSLACPDTTFLFMECGENMMVHLSYISDGWEAVAQESDDPSRTVFFEQIWHGACPHTFMCFRKLDKENDPSNAAEMDLNSRFGESGLGPGTARDLTSMDAAQIEENLKEIKSLPRESSEINIALTLNQERCENLSVPLNVLAHNIKVKISDTQVKVIDERIS